MTSGAGGGGRVAVYYDSLSIPIENITAPGGSGGWPASAGTVYLKSNAHTHGDLIVDNANTITGLYTPLRSSLAVFRSMTIKGDATMGTTVNLSFPAGSDLNVSKGGTLSMQNNTTLSLQVFDTTDIKNGGTVWIPKGSRLDIAANSATIGSGATLVKDGTFGGNDSINTLTIDSSGVVTHVSRDTAGLRLHVLGILDIRPGGAIDVSGKGLLGGNNGSAFGADGETFDSSGAIVSAENAYGGSGAGGSYGGFGGDGAGGGHASSPYGLAENPNQLGSGGAEEWGGGGNGGGRVTITAVNCIVDGAIRANGANRVGGYGGAHGGGSGGAIKMTANTLSGGGSIQARGENVDPWRESSGGGGRIAIYYTTNTFITDSIDASSGSSIGGQAPYMGSAGTIYLKDNAQAYGDLIIDNKNILSNQYTPLRTALNTFRSLTIRNSGQLHPVSTDIASFTVQQPITLVNSSVLWLSNGVIMNVDAIRVNGGTFTTSTDESFPLGTELEVSNGGILNIQDNATLSIGIFNNTNIKSGTVNISTGSRLDVATNIVEIGAGVTLVKDGAFGTNDSINTLTIDSGGVVTHSTHSLAGLRLHVFGTLDVQAGGKIDVSGRGLYGGDRGTESGQAGETFDTLGNIVAGAAGGGVCGPGAGGSYGGVGGGTSGPIYGYLENPNQLGSGGGGGGWCWGWGDGPVGGNGGGRITITTTSCVVNGAIIANGGRGLLQGGMGGWGGGGSGGGIRIDAGRISGVGTIVSGGGNSEGGAGAGGGGRVAIYYDTLNFPTENVSANGGTSGLPGNSGTILFADKGQDLIMHSSADVRLILSPAGNIPFEVTLRDKNNMPLSGSTDVWLDFSGVSGLIACPSLSIPIQIPAPLPSDSSGRIRFYIKGGGCTSDLVKVKTSKGLIAQVPIKSLDHNGGLLVTAADFVGDACNDYNNDGVADASDFDFFIKYLGHTCIDNVTNYIQLSLVTNPPPDRIFIGDTVDVCGRIISVLDESILLDSVVFSSAQFGIAQPWAAYGRYNGTVLNPRDTLLLCEQFLTNAIIHGCWKIQIYARLLTSMKGEQLMAQQQAGQAQVNGNGNVHCRPGREPYKRCPLCGYCVSGDVDGDGICDDDEAPGCVNADDRCRPLNQIGPNGCPIQHSLQPTISMKHQTDTLQIGYSASVPIGSVYGDSLYLYRFSFMPEGWSFSVSDSGWIHTPDTVHVTIYHNPIIHCNDTGRVIFYAYDSHGEFAGNAVISVQSRGQLGDYDLSNEINASDLEGIVWYLYQWSGSPFDLGSLDLTGDNRIDIADVTRLVDYLYVSHEPLACVRDTGYVGPEISIATSYLNDTTTLSLVSSIDLKGLQLELVARKYITPDNLLGDSIGIALGSLDSLYRIGLFDLNGGAVIPSGVTPVLRIPGLVTIVSSRASDRQHHSLPLTTGRLLALGMQSGWNLLSLPVVVPNPQKGSLFPTAVSSAYAYQKKYIEKDTLECGRGYWLKFRSGQTIPLAGAQLLEDTISVYRGWNMVGSISDPVRVSTITSDVPGMRTSRFYRYTGSIYQACDTIDPGTGYWVKAYQAGKLILSTPSSGFAKAAAAARIQIVPTSELPPPPPDGEAVTMKDQIPTEYALEQNYPNPFNPTTVFEYALPLDSKVKLTVYDVLGQAVVTLVDEIEQAGYRSAEWNASAIASGIYFYRLDATSIGDPNRTFQQVKKMALIK